MNLSESFFTALDSLLANKLRSVLTMLGVIIGVAAVIALLSIGNGVNASISGEIQAIGTNLIAVVTDFDDNSDLPTLSMSDLAALQDPLNVPAVSAVAANSPGSFEIVRSGKVLRTSVLGVTANYFDVNNLNEFAAGDKLTQTDLDTSARVAVIGPGVAAELFPDSYPVGDSMRINGVSYEVIGVLEESGSAFNSSDDVVYVPLTTGQSRLFTSRTRSGERAVTSITVQAVSEEQTDAAIEQITETLRRQHGIVYTADDDFTIVSQADLLETLDLVTGTLTAFLGAIAGISLVVGGIGIMNIMLVSVTERTREIGIRKAIGALKRDILLQFLLESMLLSLFGGFLGMLLGWAIATLAARALDIQAVTDIQTVLMATGFALVVGLIFGIYPAWRAAGLRPIEALRYE